MVKNNPPDVWDRVVGLIVKFLDRRSIVDHAMRIKTLAIMTRAEARAGRYEAVKQHFSKPKDEHLSYEAVREIIKRPLFLPRQEARDSQRTPHNLQLQATSITNSQI